MTRLPSFCKISLQPNSGFTGAHVPDRARQTDEQSPCLRHCLPASRVRVIHVFSVDFPAFPQFPPRFSQLICSFDFCTAGSIGITCAGESAPSGGAMACWSTVAGNGRGTGLTLGDRAWPSSSATAVSVVPSCPDVADGRPSAPCGNILQATISGNIKTRISRSKRIGNFHCPTRCFASPHLALSNDPTQGPLITGRKGAAGCANFRHHLCRQV